MLAPSIFSSSGRVLLAFWLMSMSVCSHAGGHRQHGPQSYHVDVHMYGQGELNIKRWLNKYAGLDTDHYYLTGVIVHADAYHRSYGGYALLRISGDYSSRIELRPGRNYIPAPRLEDGKWRLYVREGAQVRAVTLLVEPRLRYTYGGSHDQRRNDGNGDRRYDSDYFRDRESWSLHGSPFDRRHFHDRNCRH